MDAAGARAAATSRSGGVATRSTRRALAIVRACNGALVRAEDEAGLLDRICRIAVEVGGYRMAWVGFKQDDPERTVLPVAHAGQEDGYLAAIHVTWADDALGQGPTGTAIRTGQPAVFHQIADDSRFAPWQQEAARRSYVSALSLPLMSDGETFGALTIWSSDPGAFSPLEVDLLSELSGDLGFGILTLRVRAERATLAAAVEQAADSIVITDPRGAIRYVNPAFERRSGYGREEVTGRRATDLPRDGVDRSALRELTATVRRGVTWRGTISNRRKDGPTYHEETIVTPLTDSRGLHAGFVYTGRDVTRERELETAIARKAREQTELAARLGRLRMLESTDARAQQIVEEITRIPGMDFASLACFGPGPVLIPVVLHVPPGTPVAVGRPVPTTRAQYLRDRSASGPWVETWRVRREDRTYGRQMAASGLRAVAYAPIYGPRSLVGILTMGTSSPAVAEKMGEHFPTLVALAAFAEALLGPAYELASDDAAVRARIEATIAANAFAPVFQPVVTLPGREVVGYEALTRFADGQQPAVRFAEAASVGLGPALEVACLGRAVAESHVLPSRAWLGLNASPAMLMEEVRLGSVLSPAGREVVLEVTEHAVVEDYAALRDHIGAVRPRVRLAVDDAGAGYAGLQHILELRPDIVKLDIALIHGIDADMVRQGLVAGMAHFAARVGCQLLAEGVETEAEASTLVPLGVKLGQGFLFGHPAPVTAAGSSAS